MSGKQQARLIVVVAGLAATSFSCVPPPTSNFATSVQTPRPQLTACNPAAFQAKIYTISNTFNPTAVGSNYNPPTSMVQSGDSYKTTLGNAFCAASISFQKQLMDLDGIFITCADPNNCVGTGVNPFQFSWGYRENKYTQSTLQHKYVGLSEQLWNGAHVPTYSTFETTIASQLLYPYSVTTPITVSAVPNSENLTVLAALAHEYGHVDWWRFDVEYSKCPTMGTLFSSIYWKTPKKTKNFHKFGETQGDVALNNVPTKAAIVDDLQNHPNKTYGDLLTIYGGAWVSLFAAVSPDEDFIKSYKLWILTTAQQQEALTSLSTNYTNGNDIVGTYLTTGTPLYSKVQWISQCFAWPSNT